MSTLAPERIVQDAPWADGLPDLDAHVPCALQPCDKEAKWRGSMRHASDGQVCQSAPMCHPHRQLVNNGFNSIVADHLIACTIFGREVNLRCQPHLDHLQWDPIIEWVAL